MTIFALYIVFIYLLLHGEQCLKSNLFVIVIVIVHQKHMNYSLYRWKTQIKKAAKARDTNDKTLFMYDLVFPGPMDQ